MRKVLSSFFKKISEWLENPSPQGGGFELEKEEILSSLVPEKSIFGLEKEDKTPKIIEESFSPPPPTPLENPTDDRPQNLPLKEVDPPVVVQAPSPTKDKETKGSNVVKRKTTELMIYPESMSRDVADIMEFPFLALSKNRTNPIIYESSDKTQKVVISGHRGHFLASIYDWDILLVVAGKLQETLNKSEIPSHTVFIPRHELLKALHKQDGKKQQKDLEKSLSRLQLTGIETTINNKDFRHKAGFGFINSWGYKERKNDRETRIIEINLSPWLYELCCAKGSLLKPNREYFEITSGLKKFLYRTARKHAGKNKDGWWFSIESLYEKSGSEQEFKKFKSDVKAIVLGGKPSDKIPDYSMEWLEIKGVQCVLFKKSPLHELTRLAEKYGENSENYNKIKELNEKEG